MLQKIILLIVVVALPGYAQTFDSGSTGADGPLSFPPNAGTIIFDPATLSPPLAPDHGTTYHFTTITVPAGTTVRLKHGPHLNGPVTWLAQGAVTIAGIVDLNGENGVNVNSIGLRIPAVPGAGGFYGGLGGNSTAARPPTSGLGPGGGTVATLNPVVSAFGGTFAGNNFLVPLFGGSGGGGGISSTPTTVESGGGAGGGALLIASSTSITIAGGVRANGGRGGDSSFTCSGGGSGGAIRLMAPQIAGTGSISVSGGSTSPCGGGASTGSSGRIRIEAFQHLYNFSVSGGPTITSSPFDTYVTSTGNPTIRVKTVDGVAVNPSPSGTFETPDVVFNNGAQVPVVIEAQNVPLTAPVKLQIYSEDGPDQTFNAPALTGTLALSTTTVNVPFPTGFSRGFLRATFTTTP
jgi:hypothetical protein